MTSQATTIQLIAYSAADVDLERAERAHNGTSFSPERRTKLYQQNYVQEMKRVNAMFAKWRTDENEEAMKAELESFRLGYLRHMWEYLDAHSRIMSQMITGSGGWTHKNIRANNKRCDTTHKRLGEWVEYTPYKLNKIQAKFDPYAIANRPIRSDDVLAIEDLQKKLAACELSHARMKATNQVIKAGKGASFEELVESLMELGHKEEHARNLLEPRRGNSQGYETFFLTNNSAEIRRLKGRIAELEARDARLAKREETTGNADYEQHDEATGITYREDATALRVMLIFPGKPDEKTRTMLKGRGFRWSPKNNAWQRLLNDNGTRSGRAVYRQLIEAGGEGV